MKGQTSQCQNNKVVDCWVTKRDIVASIEQFILKGNHKLLYRRNKPLLLKQKFGNCSEWPTEEDDTENSWKVSTKSTY